MSIITIPVQGSFRNTLNNQSLRVFEKAEWGSLNPDHRIEMRRFLLQHASTSEHSGKLEETLLDLNQIPVQIGAKFCSLSHSMHQGMIAFCENPVGIDLEKSERVQPRVVARVSSEKELQRAPSASALWCAKEAAFKALRSYQQPEVLSQLEIGGWRESQDGLLLFELKNSEDFGAPQGRGAFYHNDIYSLAIFVFST